MFTIRLNNYGLGTYIDKSFSNYYINHNGSGYGYSATFAWFPEYNIGTVLLCNKHCNTFQICEQILKNYIMNINFTIDSSVARDLNRINGNYFAEADKITVVKKIFCSADTLYKADWQKYTEIYALMFSGLDLKWYARLAFAFGFYPQKLTIVKEGQTLRLKSSAGESVLREHEKGMFFTEAGEMVNFNLEAPAYKNIKLKKIK